MSSKIKYQIMSREIKSPMKSRDAQQKDESTRPRDQNIIVNIYYVPSVDTPIVTSKDKEGQTGLRQEKKITIWECWEWIEIINRAVDFFKNMKDIGYFVYTHYFPVFVSLDIVKHFFNK